MSGMSTAKGGGNTSANQAGFSRRATQSTCVGKVSRLAGICSVGTLVVMIGWRVPVSYCSAHFRHATNIVRNDIFKTMLQSLQKLNGLQNIIRLKATVAKECGTVCHFLADDNAKLPFSVAFPSIGFFFRSVFMTAAEALFL